MSNRVLVIGACGFVGRSLCRALTERGIVVRAVCRRSHPSPSTGYEQVVSNCHKEEDIEPLLENVGSIIYLAATSSPGSSAGKPLTELENGLKPLLTLLEALQARPNIRLVYFSSAGALYGEKATSESTEDELPQPKSYHGAAKVAAEQFIGAWARQFNGNAVIIRPSNIYGPGQNEKAGFGIIPAALGCIQREEILTVWGDGSSVRDYLFIDDLIELVVRTLQCTFPEKVKTLNAASGDAVSLNALFTLAEQASGRSLKRVYQETRSVDASSVVVNSDLAREVLDWRPSVRLADGIRRTWNWLNTSQR